jgi:carbamoyl-phosphate synthase large subunit
VAVIGGLLQHVEEAGIHSGDSTMVLPAHTLPAPVLAEIRRASHALALELGVRGLMNVQFAVRGHEVFVIEVNPRASRTVPFVSKSIGKPLAKIATKVMAGKSLRELGFDREILPPHVAVKESVFPFAKLPGVDTILGPEMRSTGEVMGIGVTFSEAFDKAMLAAGNRLPQRGTVFVSVRDQDKALATRASAQLVRLGFRLVATDGTAAALRAAQVPCERINKVGQGSPHCVDLLKQGGIDMVINTTFGVQAVRDSYSIRRQTLMSGIAYFTTMAAASAAVDAIEAARARGARFTVRSLQEYHEGL